MVAPLDDLGGYISRFRLDPPIRNVPPVEYPPSAPTGIEGNAPQWNGDVNIMPVRPAWTSNLDYNGLMKSPYRLNPLWTNSGNDVSVPQDVGTDLQGRLGGVNLDQTGLSAVKDRALQQGPSPWMQMQSEAEKGREAENLEKANQLSEGTRGDALNQLMMRGGLHAGSGENIAKEAMANRMNAEQQVRRASETNQSNIGIADQQMKDQFLSMLPGASVQAADFGLNKAGQQNQAEVGQEQMNLGNDWQNRNFDYQSDLNNANNQQATQKYNIETALSDTLQKRVADLASYNQQMKAWAASKTGQAIAGSGKK
jgi:hypothetical protein